MNSEFSCKLTPDAEREYLDSYLFYEERQEGLGERFAISIRRRLHLINSNPYLFSRKKGRYHEVLLSKTFPFVIVYVIEKKEKQIVVTAIFHTSRNPKKKYRNK